MESFTDVFCLINKHLTLKRKILWMLEILSIDDVD